MAYRHNPDEGARRGRLRHEVGKRAVGGWTAVAILLALILAALLLFSAFGTPVDRAETGLSGDGVTAPAPVAEEPAPAVPEEVLPGQPVPDAGSAPAGD